MTFSFSVAGGSTNLGLRYSAGNGVAHRKIELDGSVLVANQAFAATAGWSTWSTLTLNQPALAAGPHTLKVWFDAAAGSNQFINLDNLTVTQVVVAPPPQGVVVSLGYAHGAGRADSVVGLRQYHLPRRFTAVLPDMGTQQWQPRLRRRSHPGDEHQ